MRSFRRKRNRRPNLLLIAIKHFPGGLLKTGIGITLLSVLVLLTILTGLGIQQLLVRYALIGLVIVILPTLLLYIITLVRAPRIRRRGEAEAVTQLEEVT